MKNIFIYFLLAIVAWTPGRADDGDDGDGATTEVPMTTSSNGSGHNRSSAMLPLVTYNLVSATLTVTFCSDDSFQLTVADMDGNVEYSTPIVTDGTPNAYTLSLETATTHLITISSTGLSFIGYLMVP